MRKIHLDAAGWAAIDDFYKVLLPTLGAPAGHGRDINALIDSVIGGGMNSIQPPYKIIISGTASADKAVLEHVKAAKFYLAEARAEALADWDRDVDVTIEIAD